MQNLSSLLEVGIDLTYYSLTAKNTTHPFRIPLPKFFFNKLFFESINRSINQDRSRALWNGYRLFTGHGGVQKIFGLLSLVKWHTDGRPKERVCCFFFFFPLRDTMRSMLLMF
jgi:hypothetical protein